MSIEQLVLIHFYRLCVSTHFKSICISRLDGSPPYSSLRWMRIREDTAGVLMEIFFQQGQSSSSILIYGLSLTPLFPSRLFTCLTCLQVSSSSQTNLIYLAETGRRGKGCVCVCQSCAVLRFQEEWIPKTEMSYIWHFYALREHWKLGTVCTLRSNYNWLQGNVKIQEKMGPVL